MTTTPHTPTETCKLMFPDDKRKQRSCIPLVRTLKQAKGRGFSAKVARAVEKLNALQNK